MEDLYLDVVTKGFDGTSGVEAVHGCFINEGRSIIQRGSILHSEKTCIVVVESGRRVQPVEDRNHYFSEAVPTLFDPTVGVIKDP